MPDKFGWDNHFGNNPAPTRHARAMAARQRSNQISVEFLGRDGPDDWRALHTGLSSLSDAAGIAERLYRGMTDGPAMHLEAARAKTPKVRVCETPFGRVLAVVNVEGKCVPASTRGE